MYYIGEFIKTFVYSFIFLIILIVVIGALFPYTGGVF